MALSGLIVTDADSTMVAFGSPTVVVDSGGGGAGGTSLFSQTQAVEVANTGSNTTLVGTGVGTAQVATNTWAAGEVLRGTASGIFGTLNTNPGSVAIQLLIGSEVTLTFTINPSPDQENQPWKLEYEFVRITAGASGTVRGTGYLTYQEENSAAVVLGAGMTAAATVPSDAAQDVIVKADWLTADSTNTWLCYLNYFELLGTAA